MDSFLDHLLDNSTLPPLTDYFCSTERPISSLATEEYEFKANISSPHNLDPNPTFCPLIVHPNSVFPYQSPSLVYPHQDWGLSSMMTRYPTNFPVNEVLAPNIYIGGEEPGITSARSKVDNEKPSDQELEGLSFSPNISDLYSLWSY